MRQPILVQAPPAQIARLLRDEKRATSLVYEHLVTTAGLGVAEQWIERLAWARGEHRWGIAQGWYLYATPGSERIARAPHRVRPAHVLAFSRRAWQQATADYYASDYYQALSR